MEFPQYKPQAWVLNQVQCIDRPPPEDLDKWDKGLWRSRFPSWFVEYVHYDNRQGRVRFGVPPPHVRKGRRESLRRLIEDMFNAYDLLFEESVRQTLISCYLNLSRRDLAPEVFQVPQGWRIEDVLFGVPLVIINAYGPLKPVVGAFTDTSFKQYEPLPYDPEVWAWHDEGPIGIRSRFGIKTFKV